MRRIVLIACLFGIVLQFWRLANIQETYSPNDSIMEMKVTKEMVMLLLFFLGLVVTGRSLNKEDE